jgi:phosphatidylethanolamine/phosphatidyl-N-methylethanolamine N-methyltransferase
VECSTSTTAKRRDVIARVFGQNGVTILHGDAAKLGELLPHGSHIDAIVSSLPLRSLPAREAAAIVAQWRALIGDGGIVVQFTYDLRGNERQSLPGFLHRASDIVWANLPPARVLALEYCSAERKLGQLEIVL